MGEIVEAWCAGEISTSDAINRGDFDDFAELLDFAIRSNTPLRTEMTEREAADAAAVAKLLTSS